MLFVGYQVRFFFLLSTIMQIFLLRTFFFIYFLLPNKVMLAFFFKFDFWSNNYSVSKKIWNLNQLCFERNKKKKRKKFFSSKWDDIYDKCSTGIPIPMFYCHETELLNLCEEYRIALEDCLPADYLNSYKGSPVIYL